MIVRIEGHSADRPNGASPRGGMMDDATLEELPQQQSKSIMDWRVRWVNCDPSE